MSFEADFLAFSAAVQKAQKELDCVMGHQSEVTQRLVQQMASVSVDADFLVFSVAVQKAQKELDSMLSHQPEGTHRLATQEWAREREAFLAVPILKPCSILDWSVISPRQHVRMPSLAIEPSNKRTIVRPEVKRKIGFGS